MKIPSLIRVPKHRRFNFEPRHYDSIKEDLKNRTELIEQQLKNNSSETAIKQRLSETFVRDKHRTGGKLNGLQLALALLLSAAFVGFVYIGFYAFFITGVIILIYVLFQVGMFKRLTESMSRPSEPEEEQTTAASKIAAGQMREGQYFYRERNTGKKGGYKLFLLVAAMGVAAGYYYLALNGIMCLLLIFILLILFVKESSKA
jgi:uncharacterized membrane protein YhaH (DUF805 family)